MTRPYIKRKPVIHAFKADSLLLDIYLECFHATSLLNTDDRVTEFQLDGQWARPPGDPVAG